jgi:two-component system capsular synthesis sensor histidine kinase RcsC
VLGGKPIPEHLRGTFTESCMASLAAIHAARENGDVAIILAELHSLRGALGVFGQTSLARWCAEIESQVRIDGLTALTDQFVRFDASVRTLIER